MFTQLFPQRRLNQKEHCACIGTNDDEFESTVVGPDRLELSTSVLSGPRSNHLSYGPTTYELYCLSADLDKGFLAVGCD